MVLTDEWKNWGDRTSQVSNKCTTLKNLFSAAEGKVKKNKIKQTWDKVAGKH
jgi:hypothetical protein